MKAKPISKLYIVKHRGSGATVSFGAKCAWISTSAAKNAVLCHGFHYSERPKKFEDQSEYWIDVIYF